jgi:hypothetical protein
MVKKYLKVNLEMEKDLKEKNIKKVKKYFKAIILMEKDGMEKNIMTWEVLKLNILKDKEKPKDV